MAISAAHRAAIMESRVFEGQAHLLRKALEEIVRLHAKGKNTDMLCRVAEGALAVVGNASHSTSTLSEDGNG